MNSTTATIATVCAETAETMNRTALVMGKGIVELLASKYGFDAAEAFEAISFEMPSKKAAGGKKASSATEKQPKGDKVKKVKIPLPFVGIINAEWCMGIRTNQGLFTQCTNAKPKDGSEYCPTCAKQAETNATGKPTYGNINDRAEAFEAGIEWRDPKENKAVAHYANVAAKLKIDLEVAKAECLKVFGVAIPDDQLEVKATQRGRPKKSGDAGSAIVSDTDSASSTASGEAKKRGRPKKVKTVIEGGAAGDDLIAGLVAAAQNGSDASSATPTKKTKAPKPELTEEEKAAKLKAAAEKRAATLAAKKAAQPPKPELSDEEKLAKRKEAAEKRKAAAAEKQAAIVLAMAQSLIAAEKQASSASDSEKPKTPVKSAATPKAKAKPVVVAKAPEPEPELEVEDLEEEEEETEEGEDVEVEKWVCPVDDITYLKSPDNVLYDLDTQEPVGVWNETTQQIDATPSDDDDYC